VYWVINFILKQLLVDCECYLFEPPVTRELALESDLNGAVFLFLQKLVGE